MHLCLAKCEPHSCSSCGACGPQPGLCRECKVARQILPPMPKRGRGLEGLKKELGLGGD